MKCVAVIRLFLFVFAAYGFKRVVLFSGSLCFFVGMSKRDDKGIMSGEVDAS